MCMCNGVFSVILSITIGTLLCMCRTPNEDEFKTHTHGYNLSFSNQIGRVNITITVLLYKYITSLNITQCYNVLEQSS